MALRKILVGGAAVAALAVVAASMPSAVPGFVSQAQADVDVSINLGTFYNDLSPYGDWVSYNNSYVFVPAGADPRWRPYTHGRWEYTNRYGWVWVSDDRHGWATHHYGRWGHAAGIGWYWVPDTQWGPAWVDWRRDDEYVAWAPLAPGGNGVSVVVDAAPAPVPDYYWAAVAAPNFLAPNLAINIIDRDDRRYDIIRRARPIGHVRYRNNVVVNNFIDIDYVEKRTKRKVEVREIRNARDRREAGKRDGNQLAIYSPRVERKGDAKPKKAESVEQVARKKRTENPQFATRTEELQKRRALKRETEETDKAAEKRKEKREKAKEAATQPADAATDNKQKQKAREERKRQQEQEATKQDEQTSKKKAREERKRQQDQEATKQNEQTNKQKERAAKNAEAEKQQKAKQRQEKQQENKKKKQQQQESLAPRQQENQQAKARKAEERKAAATKAEKPAKREKAENNKKKKQQDDTAQQ